ncbi:translation initiation factor 2 [Micromonospora sp. NPDC049559]|uniref:translation initiation factor 2 n=1 Tax=Micromonospora sp. NPDC049559 TaxID=3155923 RepID=UPI0034247BFB
MTTPHGANPDDSVWRRPPGTGPDVPPAAPAPQTEPEPSPYPGPPAGVTPPASWRPPVYVQPPPPRRLPEQDLAGVNQAEQSARTVTYGVGLIAGAVILVLMCLLCSRVLF